MSNRTQALACESNTQIDSKEAPSSSGHPIQKLNQMSLEDRERGMQDLHGVSDIITEEPAFVQRCLESIKNEPGMQHVDDTELIKILRVENFIPSDAAKRYHSYQETQMNLFGKRGKLSYSDLSEQDRRFLQSGFMQLLPQRDRAGRAIMICIGSIKYQLRVPLGSDLRCMWFLASQAAMDEETQKRGLVMLYYGIGQKQFDRRENRPKHFLRTWRTFPVRVVACHYCFDKTVLKPFIDLIFAAMESNVLCRFRPHFGKHMECQYSLMTFGVPKECLPIDFTGQVDLTNHNLFLQTFASEEIEMDGTGVHKFLIPGNLDIIMGRGQHAKNSPGHNMFKSLLEENQNEYESVDKYQKTAIADLTLKKLNDQGCRFLKPIKEGGWVEVSEDVGRAKINHAFRNLRVSSRRTVQSQAAKRPFGPYENMPFHATRKPKYFGMD